RTPARRCRIVFVLIRICRFFYVLRGVVKVGKRLAAFILKCAPDRQRCRRPALRQLRAGSPRGRAAPRGRAHQVDAAAAELLQYLVEHPGEILGREEIQREIWGSDTVVEFDRNLNVCIAQLRSVLNDDSASPRFIETVPKRGYRFVAPVVTPEKPQASSRPYPRRWVLAGGLGALVFTAVVVFVFARNPSSVPDVRLAVMPFENLSGDANDEPAVAGLTDELISAFGSVQPVRLGVIGRSSVMRYKNSRPALEQMARELRVHYLVEGTLRKDAGRVRVAA